MTDGKDRCRVRTDDGEPMLDLDGERGVRLRTYFTQEMNGEIETMMGEPLKVSVETEPDGSSWLIETPEHAPNVVIVPERVELSTTDIDRSGGESGGD